MSTLDVVAEILREVAPRALKARQIAELAGSRLPTASKTPATVVSRDLAINVRDRGASSRFLRVGRGEFVLKGALPTAFYNDNDAYAAAWTRNLVAAGEIAAGVVDERSIRDLKPADVASYRQCHFFSGIGVWSRALRDAGWPDDVNVWTGSAPCTPWSSAGRKRGLSDEQHLWPEWYRLIAACRPAWLFGEQVSSKDGLAWLDVVRADLEAANYALRVLDIPAACTGAPHARHRLYFAAYARERTVEIIGAPWLREHVVEARYEVGGHGDVHGDGHGTGCGCLGAIRLGDTCLSRGGGNTGTFSGAEEVGQGERIKVGDLPDESVASSATDGNGVECGGDGGDGLECEDGEGRIGAGTLEEIGGVRGAVGAAGNGSDPFDFRAGDRIRIDGDTSWGGAVGGFWAANVEWIYCRPEPGHQDGRWRPVESGTLALVDGLAPSVGRTRSKRLRGYGNAIVRPLAVVFVASVIDALSDAVKAGVPLEADRIGEEAVSSLSEASVVGDGVPMCEGPVA